MAKPTNRYPSIQLPQIQNPLRWYAIPILGGISKLIMLIPVGIWLVILGIAYFFVSIINSFFVLFTGRYWQVAYELGVTIIHLSLKVSYFFGGLTNLYPGFSGKLEDFSVDIPFPQKPNRLFAIPIFGGLVRLALLIPYFIYSSIMQYAGNLGAVVASFFVLFTGSYPEAFYEIVRDSVRLSQATTMYMAGLSDEYPSWWISMHHKVIKIILIILAVLFMLNNYKNRANQAQYRQQYNPYYQTTPTITPSPTLNTVYNY